MKTLLETAIAVVALIIVFTVGYRWGQHDKAQQIIRVLEGLRMKSWEELE